VELVPARNSDLRPGRREARWSHQDYSEGVDSDHPGWMDDLDGWMTRMDGWRQKLEIVKGGGGA
jgi:hypothetical protein